MFTLIFLSTAALFQAGQTATMSPREMATLFYLGGSATMSPGGVIPHSHCPPPPYLPNAYACIRTVYPNADAMANSQGNQWIMVDEAWYCCNGNTEAFAGIQCTDDSTWPRITSPCPIFQTAPPFPTIPTTRTVRTTPPPSTVVTVPFTHPTNRPPWPSTPRPELPSWQPAALDKGWAPGEICRFQTTPAAPFSGPRSPNAFCGKSAEESKVMCLPDSPDLLRTHATPINQILDGHNCVRRTLNNPRPGTPMPLMQWDDELAGMAERWAAQCLTHLTQPSPHIPATDARMPSRNWHWVGQNLAWGHQNWNEVIRHWANEESNWEYGVGSRYPNDARRPVGHFTQIVWETTLYVGCASAECRNMERFGGRVYVCQYGPGGNRGTGQAAYARPYET